MLAEERFSRILSIIEAEGSATIQELMTALDASESTVRRDLITMDENGLLTKVHGGAIARRPSVSTHDEDVRNRKTMNAEQKNAIAKYAASLIRPDDFVYLDAGTSTEAMIPFIKETQAVFVTNAISHAKLLAEKGCRVYLLGGEFNPRQRRSSGRKPWKCFPSITLPKDSGERTESASARIFHPGDQGSHGKEIFHEELQTLLYSGRCQQV